MLLTIQRLALLLAWCVCASQGKRLQTFAKRLQSSVVVDGTYSPSEVFAGLLLGWDPASAFHAVTAGVRIPAAEARSGASSRIRPPIRTVRGLSVMADSDAETDVKGSSPEVKIELKDDDAEDDEEDEETEVVYFDPDVVQMVFQALCTKEGFLQGEGVSVDELCDIVEDNYLLKEDDDFDQVYDACDILEEEKVIRVDNSNPDESMLFLTETNLKGLKAGTSTGGALDRYLSQEGAFMSTAASEEEDEEALAKEDAELLLKLPPEAKNVLIESRSTKKKIEQYANVSDDIVIFDVGRHADYDYGAEALASSKLYELTTTLNRFGMDQDDYSKTTELRRRCAELEKVTIESPAPGLRSDPRFIGDWQLIATTSDTFNQRQGLTSLGAAPFTKCVGIFYRVFPGGKVIAKELLQFFGNNCILNELRGKFGTSQDGMFLQETYEQADMSGVRDNREFTEAQLTTRHICITYDGAIRLAALGEGGKDVGQYLVYKKIKEGLLDEILEAQGLPLVGGTATEMTREEQMEAYPYWKKKANQTEQKKKGLLDLFR